MKQITHKEIKETEVIQDLINEMKSEIVQYSAYWENYVLEDVSKDYNCETNAVENAVYYVSELTILDGFYNEKFTKTYFSDCLLEMIDFIEYVNKELVEACWNERIYLRPSKGINDR